MRCLVLSLFTVFACSAFVFGDDGIDESVEAMIGMDDAEAVRGQLRCTI